VEDYVMGEKKEALQEKPILARKFLTVKEAAAYIRRSYNWFYEHMAAGTLPFSWYFLDGKRVIDVLSLEAWINAREVKPGTPMPRRKKEAPMKR
jgi:hypothetical protein